ncbi:MAG: hypothetical protein HUK19_07930 [Fibrobacter sp.]|nr:hypothetical protein [Fibrobacter sp.]
MKNFLTTVAAVFLTASLSHAVLEIPNAQPKMDAGYWKPVLDKTWEGLKKRNIEPYRGKPGSGLIHRPKSEYPGDAVSEAVGYGMLVALYADDQKTFNEILDQGYKDLWKGCYLDWHLFPDGHYEEYGGAASDAEEDVAISLIFASELVKAGKWQPYSGAVGDYATHAKKILDCMWSTKQITSRGTLAPGAGWGGDDFVNVGYFSPAWYKVFADFDTNHDWNKVVDRSYEIIGNSPGYALGMVPDWMTPEGNPTGSLGYNAYFDAKAFYKDAIRILWRVALDAIWFDETRAKTFLQNSLTFIKGKGGASAANFFQMDGNLLPEGDVWKDMMGGTITRHRREHSPLTIGMWMTAAAAVGTTEDRAAFSVEMNKFYDKDADYFGLATDPSGLDEDTLHNEMYFEQFLAWFGTSLMTGVMNNVAENLKTPKADVAGDSSDLMKPAVVPEDSSGKDPEAVHYAVVAKTVQMETLQNGVMFSANQPALWSVFDLRGDRLLSAGGASMKFVSRTKGVYVVRAQFADGSSLVRRVRLN